MSPRYDPILDEEVPTNDEKFLANQFRDVREEVQFLRASLTDIRRDQNEWALQTNKNLVSIGRMINTSLAGFFVLVFVMAIFLLAITNEVAPQWWHTPWWPR